METILMSRKERKRLEAFGRVKAGDLTLVAASGLLGLSYRQAKRAWSRYQSQGDAGLVHRLRGRASNRQSQDQVKQQALALYCQRYARRHGLPRGLYVDQHSIYRPDHEPTGSE